MKSKKNRVLLLSSCTKPFGEKYGDSFTTQANGERQCTWAHDAFGAEAIMYHRGLDVLASNLQTPSTVLHYPSFAEFVREVKKGYDYVGISFNSNTIPKARKQIAAVRRYSPRTKIIIGGYVGLLPEQELDGLADYVCRGEGITFMRNLLGEARNDFVPYWVESEWRFFTFVKGSQEAIIIAAIGCPHGCEFCSSSYLFKREKIYFIKTGKQLFEIIMQAKRANPSLQSFIIYDDDFLYDETRVREFLDCVRESGEVLNLLVFSCINSISKYTATELAEMGISKLWIGVEGRQAGYIKQTGRDFVEISQEMNKQGITLIVSMIIGYDYQTKAIIEEEFREILTINPDLLFIAIFTPCAGTPLWDRLEQEKRIFPEARRNYHLLDTYKLAHIHPHFQKEEIEQYQRELCRREYQDLGPSIYRRLYTAFRAIDNLKSSDIALLRRRGDCIYQWVKSCRYLYRVGIMFAPNQKVKSMLREQFREIVQHMGPLSFKENVFSCFMVGCFLWTRMRYRHGLFVQPQSIRKEYSR